MPDTVDTIVAKPVATDDQLTYLQVSELVPWDGNVRSKRDAHDVEAMASSIKSVGLLNPLLVKRIDDLYERRKTLKLTAEQKRVLERTHLSFVRAGAKLPEAQKKRMADIAERTPVTLAPQPSPPSGR